MKQLVENGIAWSDQKTKQKRNRHNCWWFFVPTEKSTVATANKPKKDVILVGTFFQGVEKTILGAWKKVFPDDSDKVEIEI